MENQFIAQGAVKQMVFHIQTLTFIEFAHQK